MQHHRLHPVSLSRAVPGLLESDQLARYADAIVKVGTSVGRGDDLIISCQPAHREFAIALVEAGYRAGARSVEVEYNDPLVRAAYLKTAPDHAIGYVTPWRGARVRASLRAETATLWVTGEGEPGALKNIPGKRLAADVTRSSKRFGDVLRASQQAKRRWSIAGWPTESWAGAVYPKLGSIAAQRRLARDLLDFCRVGPDDAPGVSGLRQHLSDLRRRAQRLSRLKLERVELRGPGTDLKVALHTEGLWLGGGTTNFYGKRTAPNLPTEECFTTPIASATEGTFRCSQPLMFQGTLVDGISGEFRGGRLVRLDAKKGRDFLADFLFEIRDADRLGEVALVDSSSRIGKANRIYYNTLLDENAAAHIAFGSGFAHTRANHDKTRAARGVNRSDAHVDVMIGTSDFEATGFAARGRRVPLIAGGVWQI
jgi:aminopeptidase